VFACERPIDSNWDPNLLSRGLLSHGAVEVHGAALTPFAALAQAPRRGDSELVLDAPPVNWKKGDRLVVTGTTPPAAPKGAKDFASADGAVSGKPPARNGKRPSRAQTKQPVQNPAPAAWSEDEELEVLGVDGARVRVRPLLFDHA